MLILNRAEMKSILAGSPEIPGEDPMTCQEFFEKTGCYATWSDETCQGSDGKTYSNASSSGSCG